MNRAVHLATESGDEQLEYQARMRLTASACWGGDTDAMLSSFAWCLAQHDRDPARFAADAVPGGDLMWQYKWMVGALGRSPAFSLAQATAMLDDMEAHYRRAGLGLSGVAMARFAHAWTTGDLERAKALRVRLEAMPRDSHSHCDACTRSDLAGFAADLGDEDRALRLLDEVMANKYSCASEPEYLLSRTLVALLRAGRTQDARAGHLRSYQLAHQNPDNIEIVADNLVFCAITGNEGRGLHLVERHLPWLAHDALNDWGRLRMLTAVEVVLDAVARAGYPDQVVRGADDSMLADALGAGPRDGAASGRHAHGEPGRGAGRGGPTGGWTVVEVAAKAREAADALAAAFDARNGNSFVSATAAKTRGLVDEPYAVPIQGHTLGIPTPRPAAQPRGPAELLERALSCGTFGTASEQVLYGRRAAAATTDPGLCVEALGAVIGGLAKQGAGEEAQGVLEERLT
ncbi:MAG: hypothetical protein LBJ08_11365, partial [Bifidobacteriaceae bacterium]|nr:hypothetical protein [Bifidobacteriaceae bacterium]